MFYITLKGIVGDLTFESLCFRNFDWPCFDDLNDRGLPNKKSKDNSLESVNFTQKKERNVLEWISAV